MFIFVCVLFLRVQNAIAGDDASVHVHVESAPGPDMGMRLPLFNYYRSASGGIPDPALAAAFSKWHGDEVHSQGPDAEPAPKPNLPNSGEQHISRRSTGSSANMERENYGPAGALGPHNHRPRKAAGRPHTVPVDYLQQRDGEEYPRIRKITEQRQPRHHHGESEAIPPWLLRKRSLKKYGLQKYLSPYARIGVPSAPERYYEPDAEPYYRYTPIQRLAASERLPDIRINPYDYDGHDYEN